MVALWCIIGLIISATAVSALGAAFSISGLRDLFAGAALAVGAMAAALELAKFVLAAYLHQRWKNLNIVFKSYLLVAVVVLSVITSMGIFGFLSNAYQSASAALETETVRLEGLKSKLSRNEAEVARLNNTINEIPANRVTKRIQARKDIEPVIAELTKETFLVSQQISDANLKILEVKQKVGPLIYISKAFNMDIDNVVKYLIIVIVSVFDPLAICLVVATSEALVSRRQGVQTATPDVAAPITAETPVIHMRYTEDQDKKEG